MKTVDPNATSLSVWLGRGADTTKPNRKDRPRIASCLGLTQTTLRGIPLLDQRVVSLNQRMRTTFEMRVIGFNEGNALRL